jgi:hypothetical protein
LQGREEGQTFPLNWILKNREKQEKQGKRFLSVFFVFICFSNKNYLRRSVGFAAQSAP